MRTKSSPPAQMGGDAWVRHERLAPPRQLVHLCERQSLIRSLNVGRAGRVTLLVGPPGYGKTTALAQWRRHLLADELLVAWYSAGAAEREPSSFLRMVVRALHLSGLDMAGSGLLDSGSGHMPLDAALDAVILRMERSQTPPVLIVDDYEKVDTREINDVITELIRMLPDSAHLVLAARRRPAIALSVLHSQGAARIIGADELKLSHGELAEVLGHHTPEDELQTVADKTEGWPAVVQLYRLWRERLGGEAPIVPPGQVAEVAEYLTEQVFGALDESIQSLIVDTSIFSAVEPALVDHVRGRDDSAALLDQLQAQLPSLMQREPSRADTAYRLHPLIVDFARSQLTPRFERKRHLHARAAEWFARQHRLPEAVRHAVNSGERPLLAQLLKSINPLSTFLRDGAGELRALLREIPEPELDQHPRLQIVASLIHFKAGFVSEADRELRLIRQSTSGFTRDPAGAHDALRAEGLAVEILYYAMLHRPDFAAMDQKIALIRELAPDAPLMWAWVENVRVVMLQQRGDFEGVRAGLDRCAAVYDSHGLVFASFELLNHELLLALARGRLRSLPEQIARTLKIRRAQFSSEVPILAMTRIVGAAAAYERKPAETQAQILLATLETLSQGDSWFDQSAVAYPILAELAFLQGGWKAVERLLDGARKRLTERGVVHMSVMFACLKTHYLARDGQVDVADAVLKREFSDAPDSAEGLEFVAWREREAYFAARMQLAFAREQADEVVRWANILLLDAQRTGRSRGAILAFASLAAAAWATGDRTTARDHLMEALLRAQEDGHVAPFREVGPPLLPVLRAAAAAPELTALQTRLLEPVLQAWQAPRSPEQETLNKRETEILDHLTDGASNKLIARRLGITENTVKFHLKKVFQKMGVTTRRAAATKWETLSRGDA